MLLVYLYLPPNGLRPAPRSGRGPVGAKRPHALCGGPVALAPPRSALAGVMRAGGRDETTLLCRNHKLHKVLKTRRLPPCHPRCSSGDRVHVVDPALRGYVRPCSSVPTDLFEGIVIVVLPLVFILSAYRDVNCREEHLILCRTK